MIPLARQSHPYYAPGQPSPRQDPEFAKRVMDALREHWGDRVYLEEEVGGDPWVVNEVVNKLRRIGWVIDAQQGVPGYTLVDILPPEGWVRLAPAQTPTLGEAWRRRAREQRLQRLREQMMRERRLRERRSRLLRRPPPVLSGQLKLT